MNGRRRLVDVQVLRYNIPMNRPTPFFATVPPLVPASPVSGGSTVLVEAVRALDEANVEVEDIVLRRPTLDDVFISLTGHLAEADDTKEVAK